MPLSIVVSGFACWIALDMLEDLILCTLAFGVYDIEPDSVRVVNTHWHGEDVAVSGQG